MSGPPTGKTVLPMWPQVFQCQEDAEGRECTA